MSPEKIKAFLVKHRVASIAFGVALVMSGVTYYRHGVFVDQQADLEEKTAQGRRLLTNVSHGVLLEEHLRALQEANAAITARLINKEDLAINLQYFYKLESETGVKLVDTRQTTPQAGKDAAAKNAVKGSYEPVPYSVTLRGSYSNVLKFLRRLEQGSYFCRVLSANCNQAQGEEAKTKPETEISLTLELLGKI